MAAGGRQVGVAIDSIEETWSGCSRHQSEKISTSMTNNASAAILLAL
jgi:hypothetical protein